MHKNPHKTTSKIKTQKIKKSCCHNPLKRTVSTNYLLYPQLKACGKKNHLKEQTPPISGLNLIPRIRD